MKGTVVNGDRAHRRGPRGGRTSDGSPATRSSTSTAACVRSRRLDDKEIQLKNQSQAFFQISGAGHEAILVAAGLTLGPGYDWFHAYYRDRALCLQLGITPLEMLLASVGAADDPSNGGRQMPSHWGQQRAEHRVGVERHGHSGPARCRRRGSRRHLQSRRAHSRIARRASQRTKSCSHRSAKARRAKASSGKRSTSSNRQLPVLFLVEDNGYAISVPVEVETPGGDISRLVRASPAFTSNGRWHRFSSPASAPCARRRRTCAPAKVRRSSTRMSFGRTRTRFPTMRSCTRHRPSGRERRGAIRSEVLRVHAYQRSGASAPTLPQSTPRSIGSWTKRRRRP